MMGLGGRESEVGSETSRSSLGQCSGAWGSGPKLHVPYTLSHEVTQIKEYKVVPTVPFSPITSPTLWNNQSSEGG